MHQKTKLVKVLLLKREILAKNGVAGVVKCGYHGNDLNNPLWRLNYLIDIFSTRPPKVLPRAMRAVASIERVSLLYIYMSKAIILEFQLPIKYCIVVFYFEPCTKGDKEGLDGVLCQLSTDKFRAISQLPVEKPQKVQSQILTKRKRSNVFHFLASKNPFTRSDIFLQKVC